VRAEGGYAIWWPREGLAVEDWPICEWPEWLLREAMEPKRVERDVATNKYRSKYNSIHHGGHGGEAANLTEALRKLDPVFWPGQHDEWLMLMTACRYVGIDCEDFIAWSIGDPVYAGDADLIRLKWNSTKPKHRGALFAALKAAGIKLNGRGQQH